MTTQRATVSVMDPRTTARSGRGGARCLAALTAVGLLATTGIVRGESIAQPSVSIDQTEVPADGVVVLRLDRVAPDGLVVEVRDEAGALLPGTLDASLGEYGAAYFRFDELLTVGMTYTVTVTKGSAFALTTATLLAVEPFGGGPPEYGWTADTHANLEPDESATCSDSLGVLSEVVLTEAASTQVVFAFWVEGPMAVAAQYRLRVDYPAGGYGPSDWSDYPDIGITAEGAAAAGDTAPCVHLEAFDLAHQVTHDLGSDFCGSLELDTAEPADGITYDPAEVLTVDDCPRPLDHETLWCDVNRARCDVPADARPEACWAYGSTCLSELPPQSAGDGVPPDPMEGDGVPPDPMEPDATPVGAMPGVSEGYASPVAATEDAGARGAGGSCAVAQSRARTHATMALWGLAVVCLVSRRRRHRLA